MTSILAQLCLTAPLAALAGASSLDLTHTPVTWKWKFQAGPNWIHLTPWELFRPS